MTTDTHTVDIGKTATEEIPDHPGRTDSPEYVKSRALMRKLCEASSGFYGTDQIQDHHGAGLWVYEADDPEHGAPFLLRNLAGVEWSAQFCADPAKIDLLRQNARRLYAMFPRSVEALGIRELLDTPITDPDGVARWTDSICNASVPLPAPHHTGLIPKGAGCHNYPSPVTEIEFFKHDDFQLWVTDREGQPAAVVPVAPRGSGDRRVRVAYATPGTNLHKRHQQAHRRGLALIFTERHPLSHQAYRLQQR